MSDQVKLAGHRPFLCPDKTRCRTPVELFCEISINVRDHSPYPHTFYFGYANGWLSYLPTRQAFAEGGYDTQTNPFTKQVENDLTNVVIGYLQGHAR